VRIALTLLAVAGVAAALAVPAAGRQAANECDGLMVCIPVAGPWVVIPAGASPVRASWELRCPVGIVAGLDARVSDRAIDVGFTGLLGSPVNPGITTTNAVVFTGTYTGTVRRRTTYRPFIGCIPTSGGSRTPTGVAGGSAFRPGQPAVIRVATLRLRGAGPGRIVHRCRTGERLLGASHAVALYTGDAEPAADDLGRVRATQVVRGGRIAVSATRGGLASRIRAEVQVHALCATGGTR
jgi:hypothetical protein